MANSILPKITTFAQWVKHPYTATTLFALSLSTTLLFLVVEGNNARVRDCKEQINLWHSAYDTIVKQKAQEDQQMFFKDYYNQELKRTIDSLVQDKLRYKF